jgi:hypothetical protein
VNNSDLLFRVKQLIAGETGYPIERITHETRLQADTGMAGDDGSDFLNHFQREFCVDMAPLRYSDHFEPEGIPLPIGLGFVFIVVTSVFTPWLIPVWVVIACFLYRRVHAHTAQIRVSDLLLSAELRRWSYDYKKVIERNAGHS